MACAERSGTRQRLYGVAPYFILTGTFLNGFYIAAQHNAAELSKGGNAGSGVKRHTPGMACAERSGMRQRLYGVAPYFILTGTFLNVSSLIYRRKKTRFYKQVS
ncbi:hypothetical protein QU24_20600 [Pantoea rodasii]|uniref:Uncharacterized protein n=2 Tax=Pantoea TaxID=53335 RepID=A0A0U3V4H5_9GAMM|nr:hypothetical protein LK04_18330 [Pantoea vagans]KHJ66175.1 hypothetical protein QU24_20600 [Pantoea rodasii]